ncbi:H-2 class II histocompatibility antigen, I-E beta chain-like, partial [Thunnus maccoyii]|uniref:H-2 class II histocompatibility antigen, I-E beta chain-like n=1 Tax=Thunnus maccoyii TaxID=8240 RepID=UPI001C4B8830
MASSFLSFSLLFITVYTADGFLEATVFRCEFNSSELKDIRFIESYIHNKVEYARFDSSLGKYVGYTESGMRWANNWNNGPQLAEAKAQRATYCQPTIGIDYYSALSKS